MVGHQSKCGKTEIGDSPIELGKVVGPILRAVYNDHWANISWLSLATEVSFNA